MNINIGIIGAGKKSLKDHIPRLKAIAGVDVVAVCNRSRASSERVAEQCGIRRVHDHWTDLVTSDEVDAVVIGTWPSMHCRVTLAALAAGKHVLCEARMAMNATEARQMRDASNARPDLVTQLVPAPSTLRVDTTLKRLIAEGYLGDILSIRNAGGGAFLDTESPLTWRHDVAHSGMNMMGLGIYYESLMRWVGEATRVMAMGRTFVPMRKNEAGVLQALRVPDHLDIIADMACGAQANIQCSRVNGLDEGGGSFLFGSEGTLRIAGKTIFGGRRGDNALTEIPIPTEEEGIWRVEESFIGAIRGQEPVRLTHFDDGVRYMEFIEAVVKSMATGTAVSLPV